MKEELEYQESQRYNQWWIILFVMFPINVIFISICIYQLTTGKPVGDNPMSDTELIIVTILFFLFSVILGVVFFFMRLDTVINKEGVYERMFPFQLKFGFTPWDNIMDAGVVKKNLIEKYRFRGWGIRRRFGEKSYNTSGNYVLKLTLKSNKKILIFTNNKKIYIGTQKPEELTEFLEKLNAERKQK